jgi:hypothetical protein
MFQMRDVPGVRNVPGTGRDEAFVPIFRRVAEISLQMLHPYGRYYLTTKRICLRGCDRIVVTHKGMLRHRNGIVGAAMAC